MKDQSHSDKAHQRSNVKPMMKGKDEFAPIGQEFSPLRQQQPTAILQRKVNSQSPLSGSVGGSAAATPARKEAASPISRSPQSSAGNKPLLKSESNSAPISKQSSHNPSGNKAAHPTALSQNSPSKPHNDRPIPEVLRLQMEDWFGTEFDDVKIFENSHFAVRFGARALTYGLEVHFAPSEWQPASADGLSLLAHELMHVVQQREGRVGVESMQSGLPLNADAMLEAEADAMASAILSSRSSAPAVRRRKYVGNGNRVVQTWKEIDKETIEEIRALLSDHTKRSPSSPSIRAERAYLIIVNHLETEGAIGNFLKDYHDIGVALLRKLPKESEALETVQKLFGKDQNAGVNYEGLSAINEFRKQHGLIGSLADKVKNNTGYEIKEFLDILRNSTQPPLDLPIQSATSIELVIALEQYLIRMEGVPEMLQALPKEGLETLLALVKIDSILDSIELHGMQFGSFDLHAMESMVFENPMPTDELRENRNKVATDESYWHKTFLVPEYTAGVFSWRGFGLARRLYRKNKRLQIRDARRKGENTKGLREELKALKGSKDSKMELAMAWVTQGVRRKASADTAHVLRNFSLAMYQQYTRGDLMGIRFGKDAVIDTLLLDFRAMNFELATKHLPIESMNWGNYLYADAIGLDNLVFNTTVLDFEDKDVSSLKKKSDTPVKGKVHLQVDLDLRNLRILSKESTTSFGRIRIKGLVLDQNQDLGVIRDFKGMSTFLYSFFTEALPAGLGMIQPVIYKIMDRFTGKHEGDQLYAETISANRSEYGHLKLHFDEIEIENFMMVGSTVEYIQSIKGGKTNFEIDSPKFDSQSLEHAYCELNEIKTDILDPQGFWEPSSYFPPKRTPKLLRLRKSHADLLLEFRSLGLSPFMVPDEMKKVLELLPNKDEIIEKIKTREALEKDILEIERVNSDFFKITELTKSYEQIYSKSISGKKKYLHFKEEAKVLKAKIERINRYRDSRVTLEMNQYQIKGAEMIGKQLQSSMPDMIEGANFEQLGWESLAFETTMNAQRLKDTVLKARKLAIPNFSVRGFHTKTDDGTLAIDGENEVSIKGANATFTLRFPDGESVVPEAIELEQLDIQELGARHIRIKYHDYLLTLPDAALENLSIKNILYEPEKGLPKNLADLGLNGESPMVSIEWSNIIGANLKQTVIQDGQPLDVLNADLSLLVADKFSGKILRSGAISYSLDDFFASGRLQRHSQDDKTKVYDLEPSIIDLSKLAGDHIVGEFLDMQHYSARGNLQMEGTYVNGDLKGRLDSDLEKFALDQNGDHFQMTFDFLTGKASMLENATSGKDLRKDKSDNLQKVDAEGEFQISGFNLSYEKGVKEKRLVPEGFTEIQGMIQTCEMEQDDSKPTTSQTAYIEELKTRRSEMTTKGAKLTEETHITDQLHIRFSVPYIKTSSINWIKEGGLDYVVTPKRDAKDDFKIECVDLDLSVKFVTGTFTPESILLKRLFIESVDARNLEIKWNGTKYAANSLSTIEGIELTNLYLDANFKPTLLPGGKLGIGNTEIKKLIVGALGIQHMPFDSMHISRLVRKGQANLDAQTLNAGDVLDVVTGEVITREDGGGYEFGVDGFGLDATYKDKQTDARATLDRNSSLSGTYMDDGHLSVHIKLPGELRIPKLKFVQADGMLQIYTTHEDLGATLKGFSADIRIKFPLKSDGWPDFKHPEAIKIAKMHIDLISLAGLSIQKEDFYLHIPPHLPASIANVGAENLEYNFLTEVLSGHFEAGTVSLQSIQASLQDKFSALGSFTMQHLSFDGKMDGGYEIEIDDPRFWLPYRDAYYQQDYFNDDEQLHKWGQQKLINGIVLGKYKSKEFMHINQGLSGGNSEYPLFSSGKVIIQHSSPKDRKEGEGEDNMHIIIRNPKLNRVVLSNSDDEHMLRLTPSSQYVIPIQRLEIDTLLEGDFIIDTDVEANHERNPVDKQEMHRSMVIRATGPVGISSANVFLPNIQPKEESTLKLYEDPKPLDIADIAPKLFEIKEVRGDLHELYRDERSPQQYRHPEDPFMHKSRLELCTALTPFEKKLYDEMVQKEKTLSSPERIRMAEIRLRQLETEWAAYYLLHDEYQMQLHKENRFNELGRRMPNLNASEYNEYMKELQQRLKYQQLLAEMNRRSGIPEPVKQNPFLQMQNSRPKPPESPADRQRATLQSRMALKNQDFAKGMKDFGFLKESAGTVVNVSLFGMRTNLVVENIQPYLRHGFDQEFRGYVNLSRFIEDLVNMFRRSSWTVMAIEAALSALIATFLPTNFLPGGQALSFVIVEKAKQYGIDYLKDYLIEKLVGNSQKFKIDGQTYVPFAALVANLLYASSPMLNELTAEELTAIVLTDRSAIGKDKLDEMREWINYYSWFLNNMNPEINATAVVNVERLSQGEKGLLGFIQTNPFDIADDFLVFNLRLATNQAPDPREGGFFYQSPQWGPIITLSGLTAPGFRYPIQTLDEKQNLASSTIIAGSGIHLESLQIETARLDNKEWNGTLKNLIIHDLEISRKNEKPMVDTKAKAKKKQPDSNAKTKAMPTSKTWKGYGPEEGLDR